VPNPNEHSLRRGFFDLMELARAGGAEGDSAFLFALTCLLAPRIARHAGLPDVRSKADFLSPSAWLALDKALGHVGPWWFLSRTTDEEREALLGRAYALTEPLNEMVPIDPVEVADLCWVVFSHARAVSYGVPSYDPRLCDLLVATADVEGGDQVWVPFDVTGQIVFRVAARGATAWLAQLHGASLATIKLILLSASDTSLRNVVRLESRGDAPSVSPKLRFTHAIVTAPMGAPGLSNYWSELEQVPPVREFEPVFLDFDRSDAQAIATIWPRVSRAAIFLVSPSVLFAKGQESRLRRALLYAGPGNAVAGVYALPNRLLSHTNMAPNVLLLANDHSRRGTRMVDIAAQLVDGRYSNRLAKDLDVSKAMALMSSDEPVADLAVLVGPEECRQNDYCLLPSRYTRRVVDFGERRVPLRKLLQRAELRISPPGQDPDALTVWEIGPTQLDRWRPIEHLPEKTVQITQKRLLNASLRPGDLVVCVKGSVGKVGLVGSLVQPRATDATSDNDLPSRDAVDATDAVPAQSCIGLRPDGTHVLPEYLFAFMRSQDFLRQLDSLRVGASLPHVTPSTMLDSIQVPVPTLEEQAKLAMKYFEIRDLEARIETMQADLRDMHTKLFDAPQPN
jgi:hypothetical protein